MLEFYIFFQFWLNLVDNGPSFDTHQKKNQHNFTKGKKRQKKVDCRLMIHEIKMLFQKGPIVTLPKNLCKNASERQKSTFTYLTIQEKKNTLHKI